MNFGQLIVPVILGVLALTSVALIARHFFSTEARLDRRRRRSNTRVASTAKRPMVRFSVRTKKGRGK